MTPDQRVAWNRAIFAEFEKLTGIDRERHSSAECALAHDWQKLGVPLGTVLQGIRETGGKPRTLHACQPSVIAAQSRQLKALPPPMELEESWDAARVANEKQRIAAKFRRAK